MSPTKILNYVGSMSFRPAMNIDPASLASMSFSAYQTHVAPRIEAPEPLSKACRADLKKARLTPMPELWAFILCPCGGLHSRMVYSRYIEAPEKGSIPKTHSSDLRQFSYGTG